MEQNLINLNPSDAPVAFSHEAELKEAEKDLNKYRGYLLSLNKVFEWEPPYVPGIAIGVLTVLFAIIWYVEPTVLTLFSLVGIILCVLEYSAPFVSNQFFRQPEQWPHDTQAQYSKVCDRLLNGKKHAHCLWEKLVKLKTDKPNAFLISVVGTLVTVAWIGSLIDTLLLIYLAVVVVTMIPGLRKHGIIQKVTDLIKSKVNKAKAQ
ncbi:hypothetical protein HELRODRAFT_105135 [Helobdella robusta]|uniref:RETREG1-3/ARL6IP-like N-terminal reticulon-homology domain-containing protein n=1 Tax=Helobdella robusta TaxID=6412 RepID=T1EDR2_HELRO|nr:hypothetical protein HELRODRAFT_105135 [Helobdella robusta]ESN99677.1 hypothetical protein HELRODRAFT_105135 [Helobdella robusta]